MKVRKYFFLLPLPFQRICNPAHLIIYRNRLDIPINTQAIILFYLLTYLLIYLLKSGGLQILFTTVAIFATVNAADCKSTETNEIY